MLITIPSLSDKPVKGASKKKAAPKSPKAAVQGSDNVDMGGDEEVDMAALTEEIKKLEGKYEEIKPLTLGSRLLALQQVVDRGCDNQR
jgi:hypothetical protein